MSGDCVTIRPACTEEGIAAVDVGEWPVSAAARRHAPPAQRPMKYDSHTDTGTAQL